MTAAPKAGDRIDLLDRLRGFALLGIFLMNIEYFGRPLQDYGAGLPADLSGIDYAAGWLVYTFVQGKFWVLFSLLFGMGFAVMADRAHDAGIPFVGIYLRRTLLLAVFGLLHIILFWDGDILLAYAVTALPLLLFVGLRGHLLWLLGMGLYGLLGFFWLLSGIGLRFAPPEVTSGVIEEMAVLAEQGQIAARVFAEGDFMAVARQRLDNVLGYMIPNAWPFQIPMILGVFLTGAWLVRSGRMADVVGNRRFFVGLLAACLLLAAIGVGASLAVGTRFDPVEGFADSLMAMGFMTLGNLPATLAYVSGFALLSTTGPGDRLTAWLAPAGRMALTNYLSQSLICSVVFYGYGFAQYGLWDRSTQVAFVVIVFLGQLIFSRWWMGRFEVGPIEALWRAGTYLRNPRWRPS